VLARGSIGRDQLRQALPALLGIPLACGLVASVGIHAGYWGGAASVAVFTLLTMAALVGFAVRHARRIDKIVQKRNRLEGLFRRTFENAAVGMAHLDAAGRWLWVNDRLCEILGWPREELLRRSLREICHPDELTTDFSFHEALGGSGIESQRVVRRCVTKQGHEVWVDIVVSAERGHDGEIAHLVAVVQDVSERRQTEMELELAQRALVCSSDGVIIASAQRSGGEIVYVNPAFTRITGYTSQEAQGQGWGFLGELGNGGPSLDELCRSMQRDESASVLLRGHRKDGELRWSEIRLAPVVDSQTGAVTHHVGIQEDVTERLGAVAERERLLGEALSARADSERAGRAKDEFFALVSHELRSPLSAIASWLPMLHRTSRPEVHAQAVKVIERSVQLLTRLIGDLLDASRMASGKLEIERTNFDLLERIQTAVDGFEPAARERGVSLALHATEPHAFIEGDAERLDQIVRNLIDNALKFTPRGGRVTLAAHACPNGVRFIVSDTGPGIPADQHDRVFAPFWQIQKSDRRGAGLGLSIARGIVAAHGSRIELDSRAGEGATFSFVLPAVTAGESTRPSEESAS
jgi:PAS domain S-box-containing protein